MTCSDCSGLDIAAASLQRRLESAEADNRELERECQGLLAEIARLKDRCSALAGFAASVRERAAGQ